MTRIAWKTILSVVLLGLPLLSAQTYRGEYAVIVNPRNPSQNISSAQLRRFVLGEEKFWPGRIPVYLVLQDDRSAERSFVLKTVVKMSQGDYREHWSTLVFRGVVSSEPTEVPSNGLASGMVAAKDGALCVIRADNLPKNDSVKVLRVDGKLPGEEGYPLH